MNILKNTESNSKHIFLQTKLPSNFHFCLRFINVRNGITKLSLDFIN
jgi:hypothetical protein